MRHAVKVPGRPKCVGAWIEAARGGSTEALGELLQACRLYLLMIANDELAPELRAKRAASDLVQETFLKAQQEFGHFRGSREAELLAWLRRILLNHLADAKRKYLTNGRSGAAGEVSLEGNGVDGEELAVELAGNVTSPSGQAIREERARAVREAIVRLPEPYRQVILLRHQENRSFAEIGECVGRSADAARKLWYRAIARLERELEFLR